MLEKITRHWWLYALRGLFAVIFGILALAQPEQALQALVLVFGAYAMVDGIFAAVAGIALRRLIEHWWAMLLEGLTGIVIGILTFLWPNITALVLLYFIAAWAVITGIFEIMVAIKFRHLIPGEWAMILNGLLSAFLGVLLFVFPSAGQVGLTWLIGIYAIVAGITEMIFAFRLRSFMLKLDKLI